MKRPGSYLTLATESDGMYREKASKFIAYAFPIADEEGFRSRCEAIAREHHASRHVCYAWILDIDQGRARSNDAGEPSGTAGRPILRQMQVLGITFAAVVVVRYFGGTLLGKAGLVQAYGEAARLALANNTLVEQILHGERLLHCTYAQVEEMRTLLHRCGGTVQDATYGDHCAIRAHIPLGALPEIDAYCRRRGIGIIDAQEK